MKNILIPTVALAVLVVTAISLPQPQVERDLWNNGAFQGYSELALWSMYVDRGGEIPVPTEVPDGSD